MSFYHQVALFACRVQPLDGSVSHCGIQRCVMMRQDATIDGFSAMNHHLLYSRT